MTTILMRTLQVLTTIIKHQIDLKMALQTANQVAKNPIATRIKTLVLMKKIHKQIYY